MLRATGTGRGEEESDDKESNPSNGQVDIKAKGFLADGNALGGVYEPPSPGNLVGEHATHQRTGYARDAVHGTNQPCVHGSLSERDGIRNDDHCAWGTSQIFVADRRMTTCLKICQSCQDRR